MRLPLLLTLCCTNQRATITVVVYHKQILSAKYFAQVKVIAHAYIMLGQRLLMLAVLEKLNWCDMGVGSPRLEEESAVDRRMDASTKEHLVSIRGWRGFNNPWMHEDESDVDYSYINLLMNPERYTGYKVGHMF